ncbi:glycosyltransferase family 39 protein [Candidatus Woesearchaeota archaeon]|nr:glycosyltransferase family 39 protein [Candidatus Woesearchaeota archaeon]
MKIDKKVAFVVVALLLAFLLQSIVTLKTTSLTFDEPATMTIGYYFWQYKDTSLHIFHPTLSFLMGGFPMLFFDVKMPYSYKECEDKGIYRCADDLMFRDGNNAELLGFYSRIPFVVASLFLGLLVFFFAKEIYGAKAGVLALALYSFSPTILAYNTIILTDLIVALFIFSTMYFLWKLVLKGHTATRLVATGTSLGLALASKFTAVMLIPIIIFILSVKIFKSKSKKNQLKIFSVYFIIILLLGFAVLHATYFFDVNSIANSVPERNINDIEKLLNEKFEEGSIAKKSAEFLAYDLKAPMPVYVAGFVGQNLIQSEKIRKSYLNGEIYAGGKWQYFFEVLLIKTPIPLLIFFIASMLFSIRQFKRELINNLFLLLPIIVFFGIFVNVNFNLGLRHVLPIMPFMLVFASKVINIKFKNSIHNLISKILIFLLLAWYIISALFVMPDYMAYFNEFVGMDNGHKYLLSSNLDQGQDLKRLAEYIKSNNIGKVKLSYHGTFDPKYYNISYELLPMESYIAWGPGYTLYDPPESYKEDCRKKYGIIAISVSNLHNFNLKNESCFKWLNSYKPIKKAGYTIYVYNITK